MNSTADPPANCTSEVTGSTGVGSDHDPAADDQFIPNPSKPDGACDPAFGPVRQGWRNSMWAIENPALGVAQLTDGSRVVTPVGDGTLTESAGWLCRRSHDRHVALGGHTYTLHHTSLRRARLLRDGVVLGWMRRTRTGRFFHGGWVRTYEVVRWSDPSDRAAAYVGHLLASRYGVGAAGAVANVVENPVGAFQDPRRLTSAALPNDGH